MRQTLLTATPRRQPQRRRLCWHGVVQVRVDVDCDGDHVFENYQGQVERPLLSSASQA